MKLVHEKTGIPVQQGESLTDFRGEEFVYDSGRPPHKPSSSGFVYVRRPNEEGTAELYPSVFGLKWVDDPPNELHSELAYGVTVQDLVALLKRSLHAFNVVSNKRLDGGDTTYKIAADIDRVLPPHRRT